MKECIEVYQTLRDEIISMQERERNVWIYMYAMFIPLFVLGIEWSHYLLLVTYIVLIPFQCLINNHLWSITKLSTYIRIFFEEDSEYNIHWERLHIFPQYKQYHYEKNNKILGIMRYSGAAQLGFLSTSFFIGIELKHSIVNEQLLLTNVNIFLIIFSIILLIFDIIVNIKFNRPYTDELDSIIRDYKTYVSQEVK